MKERRFRTEADLCTAFIAWVGRTAPDVRCFAEWAGWDILLVYPQGWQVGVQAKLRLNAEVIGQAAPDHYHYEIGPQPVGPDFRALLVPDSNGLAAIASRLGLVVFVPWFDYRQQWEFRPDLQTHASAREPNADWLDWNPERRHELPETPTDSIAGSSAPVTLTPWKLRALDVLAELEIKGTITPKRMRALGVDPRRWFTNRWLQPTKARGVWSRGDKCPPFDRQHPSAYTAALTKARKENAA